MLTMEINWRCIRKKVNQKNVNMLIFQIFQSIFLKMKSCTKKCYCMFSKYFCRYYLLIGCIIVPRPNLYKNLILRNRLLHVILLIRINLL